MMFDHDWFDQQEEIAWGILDGMSRSEREAYFLSQGLTSDGLPLDVELVEAADLLAMIDGRAK
ncbi:MAG: hypothetical protein DCC68_25305 [Planctomycetota bacterium]|nr:MAG: hypothetical protein DCC68_25305 [Planctomycetota bacterium]